MNKAETFRFHLLHKREAKGILRQIEKEKGKLSVPLKKRATEYALDIFGAKKYAPWLYVYTLFAEKFKEGWIPDNYYGQVVAPKIQGDYGKLSFAKIHGNSYFETKRFPDLAYYVNGQWLSKDLQILSFGELQEVIFSESDQIVFKRDQSFQGKGVYLIQKKNFKVEHIAKLGNGVFQKHIKQHSFFNDFGTAATATIRLTTVMDFNHIASIRAAYLRMGRSGETHVQSKSQVKVGIDIASGELAEYGHLNDWTSTPNHPDTQITFKDKNIPHINKAMALCLELHAKAPYIGAIGWDVAIDPLGEIQLLEWNGFHNDIKYSEATQGPCFVDLGWEQLWKAP
jgi:hypothetical protein